jgi:hypothetical protein
MAMAMRMVAMGMAMDTGTAVGMAMDAGKVMAMDSAMTLDMEMNTDVGMGMDKYIESVTEVGFREWNGSNPF